MTGRSLQRADTRLRKRRLMSETRTAGGHTGNHFSLPVNKGGMRVPSGSGFWLLLARLTPGISFCCLSNVSLVNVLSTHTQGLSFKEQKMAVL